MNSIFEVNRKRRRQNSGNTSDTNSDKNNNDEQKRQRTADQNGAIKLTPKQCGLTRAEIIDVEKLLKKILRGGQSVADAFEKGRKTVFTFEAESQIY